MKNNRREFIMKSAAIAALSVMGMNVQVTALWAACMQPVISVDLLRQ